MSLVILLVAIIQKKKNKNKNKKDRFLILFIHGLFLPNQISSITSLLKNFANYIRDTLDMHQKFSQILFLAKTDFLQLYHIILVCIKEHISLFVNK